MSETTSETSKTLHWVLGPGAGLFLRSDDTGTPMLVASLHEAAAFPSAELARDRAADWARYYGGALHLIPVCLGRTEVVPGRPATRGDDDA